jgi:hypothetical protein
MKDPPPGNGAFRAKRGEREEGPSSWGGGLPRGLGAFHTGGGASSGWGSPRRGGASLAGRSLRTQRWELPGAGPIYSGVGLRESLSK